MLDSVSWLMLGQVKDIGITCSSYAVWLWPQLEALYDHF
jgi:hypothetical protein